MVQVDAQANSLCYNSELYYNMDLAPEQYFVYAWRYTEDTVCKLGVSTLRSFYARIKAAKTVTYQGYRTPRDRGVWDGS